ncbi:MAG: Dyp-type peroxidase [Minicystis sp.]
MAPRTPRVTTLSPSPSPLTRAPASTAAASWPCSVIATISDRFRALRSEAQDDVIGRERKTNEEMPDAPASAHVKRTAQESFDPPAFMLRRSMPWGGAGEQGLYFVAYGESLDRFERVLARMSGREDGIPDALLGFTRALSGGYYWCPPVRDGRLDLSRLGI